MGWGYDIDRNGREVGYSIQATCDWPGCTKVIDRGLGYACGGDHDEGEAGCAGYYCGQHRQGYRRLTCGVSRTVEVCNDCAKPPSKRRKVPLEFSEPGALINDIIGDICDLPFNKALIDGGSEELQVTGAELRVVLRKRLRDHKLAAALRILAGPRESRVHAALPNDWRVTTIHPIGAFRRAWAALDD